MKSFGIFISLFLGLCVRAMDQRCSLPLDEGICRGYFRRAHFDVTSQQCADFVYGGCGGNANNFKTVEECHGACKPTTDDAAAQSTAPKIPAHIPPQISSNAMVAENSQPTPGSKHSDDPPREVSASGSSMNPSISNPGRPSVFSIERLGSTIQEANPGEGGTHDYLKRKQLQSARDDDTVPQTPKQFSGDEINLLARANSPARPEDVRGTVNDTVPDCSSPADQGRCKGLFSRFNYNRERGRCEEFMYGGCAGNRNRYKTRGECELKCLPAATNSTEVPDKTTGVSTQSTTDKATRTTSGEQTVSGDTHTGSKMNV